MSEEGGGCQLRIAMIAPLIESVPPALYGGTERVVSALTEELVRRGHEVTLFASGDSRTSAHLIACAPRSLRLDPATKDYVAAAMIELGEVYARADDFDLIHNHVDYFAFPFARLTRTPTVSTTHGSLDLDEVRRVYQSFRELPLIAISRAQREFLSGVNWHATVHNGIDLENFHFRDEPGDYLVFLGRISPERRVDRAIEIARDTGHRLIIAAKVDDDDREYYEHAIAPQIQASHRVEYIGEVNDADKDALLGGAYAYLFPIDWPEPFGLTMVEAMATGTPVIAYRAGSVPEVVVDGVTGFVCPTLRGMVEAVPRVAALDRAACRAHVEAHFSAAAMATGYESAYRALLDERSLGDEAAEEETSLAEAGIRWEALPQPAG
jgi:glycosyltransferase involved in cell wall biosynthesis